MAKFFKLLKMAVWRAFLHDQFAVAKGAAYSSILTLFPAVALVASVLTLSQSTEAAVREVSLSIGRMLPEGTRSAVMHFFQGNHPTPVRTIITTFVLTMWAGSGVMISWIDGFHRAYQLSKSWGMWHERWLSFLMLILAGGPMAFASFILAFGNQIEHWLVYHGGHDLGPYILGVWTVVRWLIAALTSVAVIALLYHHGLPRTQPWHRVLPGAALATALWFPSTLLFGYYLRYFANYTVIYGSVGTAVALLIWLYLVSLVVLVGAEFNALRAPRYPFGTYSELKGHEWVPPDASPGEHHERHGT